MVEIGDLGVGADNIPVSNGDRSLVLEQPEGAPERSFTTPWFRSHGGLFCVTLAIIGPVTKESESNLGLTDSEIKDILNAAADIIILSNKQGWGEHPA